MFWACQMLTSKGMLWMVSAMSEGGGEGVAVEWPFAAAAASRLDHGALHALAGGVAEE